MYRFHIELPDDLWEKFKIRAIQEHGSPRQAALHLFRVFTSQDNEMSDYENELRRFLQDWDLQTRDAEIAADARRQAEAEAVKKVLGILVEQLGYSKEDALQKIKGTGRFPTYFADPTS